MKTRLFFLLLFVTVLMQAASAQQSKFTFGIGYQRTWMLDKQASPLKYQSSEKTISLGYTHTSNKSFVQADVNGALGDFFPTGFFNRKWYNPSYNNDGSPKQDSGLMMGTLYNARVKLSYLRATTNGYSTVGNNKLYSHNYAGASLGNQFLYTDNIVRTGWLNSTSFNAEVMHTTMLNTKHFFSIKLSIPLFARNTRLPYHNSISSPDGESNLATFFKQGSRFAWLADFQNVQLDASYEYALNKNVNLGLHYFGQWLRYSKEEPIHLFQNNISLTASLK